MIISDSERLDMLQLGANKDTMENAMMDGSQENDSANQCFSWKTNMSLNPKRRLQRHLFVGCSYEANIDWFELW